MLFAVDFLRAAHRVADFSADQLAEARAEPMHGHGDRVFRQAKFHRNRVVVAWGDTALKKRPHAIKPLRFSDPFLFHPESLEGAIENRQRPASVECLIGCQILRLDQGESRRRFRGID
jgi:hypothetical protein